MSMSKKDFENVADVLLAAVVNTRDRDPEVFSAIVTTVILMANHLERNYPNFDRTKFLDRCECPEPPAADEDG